MNRKNCNKNSSNKQVTFNTRKENEIEKNKCDKQTICNMQMALEKALKEKGVIGVWLKVKGQTFSIDGLEYFSFYEFIEKYELSEVEYKKEKAKISRKGKSNHKKYTPKKYR